MNDGLRNRIWSRDKGVYQNCQRKLFADLHEKVVEKLSSLKEIPIYKWFNACWKCQKETPLVTYDFEVVFSTLHIGDIEWLSR